jgi:hypothetical protein
MNGKIPTSFGEVFCHGFPDPLRRSGDQRQFPHLLYCCMKFIFHIIAGTHASSLNP